MNRRIVLTAGAALIATALATGAIAGTESKTFPAHKVFPFITHYYGLPPAARAWIVVGTAGMSTSKSYFVTCSTPGWLEAASPTRTLMVA